MNQNLGDLVAALKPNQALILLLLFIALLKRLGLLPPDKDEDDFASLGLLPGFVAARDASVAWINQQPWPPEMRSTWVAIVDQQRVAYQSGNVGMTS